MSVYRLPNGQNVLRSHMANFVQNISDLVKVLPRMTNTLPILIVKKNTKKMFIDIFKLIGIESKPY